METPSHDLNFFLTKEGSFTGKRNGFTLIELLIVIAIISVLAALLFPTIASLRRKQEQATCLSHMRQVGNTILLYSADHNGDLLPYLNYNYEGAIGSGLVWFQILDREGYLPQDTWANKPNGVMSCPSRSAPAQFAYNKGHYGMNIRPGPPEVFPLGNQILAGGSPCKLVSIPQPSQAFMLIDEDNWYVAYLSIQTDGSGITPHNGGLNLFFYDGHSEYWPGMIPKITAPNHYPWY